MWVKRAAGTMLGLAMLTATPGQAGDLADFNTAVEAAMAHHRVALGYLRTGSLDPAGLELDRLDAAWRNLVARFGAKRPDAFEGSALYVTTLTDISTRLVAADILFNSGRPEAARDSLQGIRAGLSALRRTSGVTVLADCILDANQAGLALLAYDRTPPDWSSAEAVADLIGKAAVYGHELKRCDAMASAKTRDDPEFRRLVDGALASLALIPTAAQARDGDLLHRVLIELRSFDNLLAFRFG